MMADNPSRWSMRSSPSHHLQHQHQQQPLLSSATPSHVMPSQYVLPGPSNSPPLSSSSMDDNNNNKNFPQSWSQLLMGGLSGGCEDYRFGMSHFQQRKLENWEENNNNNNIPYNQSLRYPPVVDVKQEVSYHHHHHQDRGFYSQQQGDMHEEFQQALRTSTPTTAWSPQVIPVSSPRSSCITTSSTNSSNILNFSNNKGDGHNHPHQQPDQSSETISTASGGLSKKPRVQASSSNPPLKVRKEKLGDRITALHQLVSPFGKTDTASVLLEAIGYIRFLQGQIEALSSPYLGNAPGNMRNQHSDIQDKPKDLRSRGLCLVPISCTLHVGNDNGADYWAPTFGGGF